MGKRVVRVSQVLDQADDSEVIPIAIAEVRSLADRYRVMNCGVSATSEEEASADQLTAIRSKIELDVVPYADFAVLRPFGARLSKAMRFTAKVWMPDQNAYVSKEIPGPASFIEWCRSWRVYRYALMVLDVVSAPKLDRYFDRVSQLVRSHGNLAGTDLWWLVCSAEARMRAERMEYIRRELEAEYVKCRNAGCPTMSFYDPRRPWDAVFLAAAGDEGYWGQEVKEAAVMYMAHLKPKASFMDEGHHAAIGEGGSTNAERPPKKPKKAAPKAKSREDKTDEKGRPPKKPRGGKGKDSGGPSAETRAKQECWKWTRQSGCKTPCPEGRSHPPCPKCGGMHPHRKPCPAGSSGA